MALVLADRVLETTAVAGTGTASLLGAQDGYQAFSVVGNGNTTYYTITDPVSFAWEVGIGTYTSSGNTLSRDTVLSSSNSGSLVSFGAGTKDIFLDLPSEKVAALGALSYQGTWNATSNVPTLASGVGTQGYYYVVATAGSTNLDGITDWKIGDWAIYSGTAWQKIDNTDAVSSVNGQTGAVVLTYSDVGAQVAGTYVTSVSGTAPVASSGGTTPAISMAKATGSVDGYLSSTDWSTFNGKQDAFGSQTANYVYAAPNGSAGVPSFRALVTTDIPSLSGSYIPYTGASSAVDLNAKTLVNVANLGVNTTSVPTIRFRVVGDNNSVSRIAMRGYSSDANSSAIRVAKFRGTVAAPQTPISGDSLGKFELAGYGSTSADSYPQASVEGVTTEIWSAIARGTKALIKVTPNTTINQVTAVTIDQDLSVTAAGALSVTGHTTFEGVTSTGATGTGKLVYDTSPTLVTPALGTPSALVGTNITGTATAFTASNVTTNANLTGAITSVGNATSLGSFTSANLAGALTDETGSGSAVFATSPTLVTPVLGTPTSGTLTNCTGLPNGGLVNSSISINGTSIALGGSSTTVTAVWGA
jgi:hypothetical protein